MVTWLVSF